MADDIVTKLIVEGGAGFIDTLTRAALAQDNLTKTISRAEFTRPAVIDTQIERLAKRLDDSAKAAELFKEALHDVGHEDATIEQVTKFIERQSKALLENAKAAQEAAKARQELLRSLPDVGFVKSPTSGKFVSPSSDEGIAIRLQQQQVIEADKNAKQLEAINARALAVRAAQLNATRLLANQEIAVEKEKQRQLNLVASENATRSEREKTIQANFARQNPLIAGGPNNVNQAAATTQEGQAFAGANRSAISYLSSLSAIHAASFLLTGRTFSTFQGISTLGLAFGNAARGAGQFNTAVGFVGAGVGVAFSGIHFLVGGIQQLVNITEQAISTLLRFGAVGATAVAGVVAASIKLASTTEDVFAEIAAFGEPTKAQFSGIDEQVSTLARTFGVAASQVGEGASLFIRAGGEIKDSINEDIAAVVRLQIAARGELIPAQSARSIVTITNAFKEQAVTADQAVNIIVGAAQKSALSFSEVTQAFQQAAPTAALLKVPLGDLATTIALLANEGLRGQVAGTGFKQFLLDLLHPSEQAKQKLQELGISIEDQNKRIRPLRDIFVDLKTALGEEADAFDKTGNAEKAQALAAIFGSRANLAAAIIARTRIEDYDKLKEAIEGVNAAEVVEILQSTTSAQLNIAKTNVEELARAFGGPLNVAIGTALKSVNAFLQGIDRSKFQLAGQAILAIITGQGFGPIQAELDKLDNSRAKEFFTGLLNSALTVRNAIVTQLIPAFQTAASNISSAFGGLDIAQSFNSITGAIVGVISVGSRLVTFVSELIRDFVTNNERGKELRETVNGLATAVKTSLVGAFLSVVVPIGAAIIVLKELGKVSLDFLTFVDKASEAARKTHLNQLILDADKATLSIGNMNTELSSIAVRLDQIGTQRKNLQVRTDFESLPIQNELDNLNTEEQKLKDRRDLLNANITSQEKLKTNIENSFNVESKQSSIFGDLRRQFEGTFNVDQITNFLEGTLPESLTATAAKLKEITDAVARGGPDREPTEGAFFPDPKKVESLARQVSDIRNRAEQDSLNVIEDTATRELELRRATLDKVLDAQTKYHRDVDKLEKETAQRITESNTQFAQSRKDRDDLQRISRAFEFQSFLREQDNARRDTLISQQDAAEDRRNQRRIQDNDSTLSRLEQREQRSEDIKNSIRDRAFQREQQDQEQRFTRQLSKEETIFTRQLQAEATRRSNAQRLAEATSPADRATIQKDIAKQALDTAFSQKQEDQLTAFREKQDKQRTEFSRKQEDNAFAQSVKNEQSLFEFRVALELKYLAIRRSAEDVEIARQNQVERQRQERTLGFAGTEFGFRLLQADALQSEQDKIADAQHARENQRTRDEAATRKKELGEQFVENLFNIFDDADRQRLTTQENAQKQLHNIAQRATTDLIQLQEREPGANIQAALLQIQLDLVQTDLLFQKNTLDAQTLFRTIRDSAITGEGLIPEAPRREGRFTIPELPAEVRQQLLRVDFSPLINFLPPALVTALQQVPQQRAPGTVTLNGNIFGTDETRNEILRMLQQVAR